MAIHPVVRQFEQAFDRVQEMTRLSIHIEQAREKAARLFNGDPILRRIPDIESGIPLAPFTKATSCPREVYINYILQQLSEVVHSLHPLAFFGCQVVIDGGPYPIERCDRPDEPWLQGMFEQSRRVVRVVWEQNEGLFAFSHSQKKVCAFIFSVFAGNGATCLRHWNILPAGPQFCRFASTGSNHPIASNAIIFLNFVATLDKDLEIALTGFEEARTGLPKGVALLALSYLFNAGDRPLAPLLRILA